MRRIMSVVIGAALLFVGVGSAHAWTWASSSNPIVMSGGGGYGNLLMSGTKLTLQSWLRDTKTGDGRVYVKVAVNTLHDGTFTNLTSGQRSDGESSYARMADQTTYTSLGVGSYYYIVRTCRSALLQDPCSDDTRRWP